jgi:hypothetical protein
MFIQKKVNKDFVAILLILIFGVYCLFPLLQTGFISDDAYSSQLRGMLIQKDLTLHESILEQISEWIFTSGRILILDWYMTYCLYYVTQDTIVVKSITISIITIGALFFYFFTKRETGSRLIALFASLLLPIFFQFRLWHDPILAFTFLIPIIFALSMGSLVLFQRYLDHENKLLYFSAVLVYLTALLMYEIGYSLCFLFFIVAYARKQKIIYSLKISLPFIGMVILILLTVLLIRIFIVKNNFSGSTYPGAELHLDINKLLTAFLIQVSSSFPLSYSLFAKPGVSAKFQVSDFIFLSFFFVGAASLIYKLGKSTAPIRFASWMASGAVLLFIPAALSSLSGHQDELISAGYGYGYITVYIQYFGACIFVVSLITLIAKKVHGRWLMVLAIFLSLLLTIVAGKNLKLNRGVALKSNEFYVYPRQLLQSALEAGIADEVKEGAFLFRTMRFPSDWMWFYTTVTGKNFITCDFVDTKAYSLCVSKLNENKFNNVQSSFSATNKGFEIIDMSQKEAWTLSYNFQKENGNSGRVILGKIDSIVQNRNTKTPIQLIVKKVNVYDLKSNTVQRIDLKDKPINFLKLIEEQTADMSEVHQLNWESLRVDAVDFEWLGKVHPREGSNKNNLRWSSGEAKLVVHNIAGGTKRVVINMELRSPTSQKSVMMVQLKGQNEKIAMSQIPVMYSKIINLNNETIEINFISDANPIANGDPRNIVFGIFNMELFEIK